jgi:alpha-L-fucosidase
VDGQTWTIDVDSARFENIENNPVLQEVSFAPTTARFFRFTALKELGASGMASVAELSVLPAEK